MTNLSSIRLPNPARDTTKRGGLHFVNTKTKQSLSSEEDREAKLEAFAFQKYRIEPNDYKYRAELKEALRLELFMEEYAEGTYKLEPISQS